MYGLVMVQQTGLPFSERAVAGDIRCAFLNLAPERAIAAGVHVSGFLIALNPFPWGLIRSERMRLASSPRLRLRHLVGGRHVF
jgi:hypothetical protein